MKILMVLSQLELTGAEVYAITIGNQLSNWGHTVLYASDTLNKETDSKFFWVPLAKRGLVQRVKNIAALVRIIQEQNIEIVHAHSRASSKNAHLAAKICNIPMVTTIHGYQHYNLSKKLFPNFGDYCFAVCENLKSQVVADFNWDSRRIEILGNAVDPVYFTPTGKVRENSGVVISIIGRLSGPKGDVARTVLMEILSKPELSKDWKINLIGGKEVPPKFKEFTDRVSFVGSIQDVRPQMEEASLIIGSGRVAMEALMMKRPVIAFGEAKYLGLLTTENFSEALKSNFGDIDPDQNWDVSPLFKDIEKALKPELSLKELHELAIENFDITRISRRVESVYQSLKSTRNYDVPVLLYHRVIDRKEDQGFHGTYISKDYLEDHFRYLKDNGYTTVTFSELNFIRRWDLGKKYIVLTFDDGYLDNYTLLFPLLKKFGFKAVIYMVTDLAENSWDFEDEGRSFPLMNHKQIQEMAQYGVEFGAHTEHHPDLNSIPIETAWTEISESKRKLEEILGKEVISFAYPYGRTNDELKSLVKEAGFKYGIGTVNGPLCIHEDPFDLRRIVIHPNTNLTAFRRKVTGRYLFKRRKRLGEIPKMLIKD